MFQGIIRGYKEVEEKAHELYPDYLFYIRDDSESINYSIKSLVASITKIDIEPYEEFEVELIGVRNDKDILLLLTRYMGQRETVINPLPFDDLRTVPTIKYGHVDIHREIFIDNIIGGRK